MTRRRNVTEQAATAAIEQGCRMLRLPTIRDRFAEIATAAEREQSHETGQRKIRQLAGAGSNAEEMNAAKDSVVVDVETSGFDPAPPAR